MASWTNQKIVVKDFYISFKPMGSIPNGPVVDVSQPITNQASDEAIYVAVTGRPAGLWNFIREIIGLSRRFEFVMSSTQCIQRLGSPSTQILSSSCIKGLNTITVGIVRPLAKALMMAFLALCIIIAAVHKPNSNMSGQMFSNEGANVDEQSGVTQVEPGYGTQYNVGQANPSNKDSEQVNSSEKSKFETALDFANITLMSIAPSLPWYTVAILLSIYAAYLFFVDKRNFITVSESGEAVVGFVISPSFLENKSTDIPLEDLNRVPMIFRALKDS